MHKAPTATVSAGPVVPTLIGPDKEKDVYILSGLVLFLAVVVAAFWYYSQADEAAHSNPAAEALNAGQVSQVLQTSTSHAPTPISTVPIQAAPVAARSLDILHDDIAFEIGRKGLTDDGKAALQRHAEFLNSEADWGVLLQGYTDQQGSLSYNKTLGMKRAETVKQYLMTLGVPETSIRTVSLGEEGALCIDRSDVCRRMNRRVHLELRKIGRDHLTLPVPTLAPPAETVDLTDDLATATTAPDEILVDGLTAQQSAQTEPAVDAASGN